MNVLDSFHPAVREWFNRRFKDPTDAQTGGWPHIIAGRDTLITAPTGSGKTLAAFLVSIDRLLRQAEKDHIGRRAPPFDADADAAVVSGRAGAGLSSVGKVRIQLRMVSNSAGENTANIGPPNSTKSVANRLSSGLPALTNFDAAS